MRSIRARAGAKRSLPGEVPLRPRPTADRWVRVERSGIACRRCALRGDERKIIKWLAATVDERFSFDGGRACSSLSVLRRNLQRGAHIRVVRCVFSRCVTHAIFSLSPYRVLCIPSWRYRCVVMHDRCLMPSPGSIDCCLHHTRRRSLLPSERLQLLMHVVCHASYVERRWHIECSMIEHAFVREILL